MLDKSLLTEERLRKIVSKVFGEDEIDSVARNLESLILAVGERLPEDQMNRALNALDHDDDDKVENSIRKIIASLARVSFAAAVLGREMRMPAELQRFIRSKLQASAGSIDDCVAVVAVALDIATEEQTETFKSLLAQARARIEAGLDNAQPQGGLTDPTRLRGMLLDAARINPIGLPEQLRTPDGQNMYVEAVIQGLELMGHGPNENDALEWAASTVGLLLKKGYHNPKDPKFYGHVQRVVTELSASVDEDSKIRIDGGDDEMFAPAPDETQRFAHFKKAWDRLKEKKNGVFLQSLAAAGVALVERYDDHKGSPDLANQIVDATYASDIQTGASGSGGSGGGSGIVDVSLPPLNDPHGYNDEIEKENIKAVSTIYVSYQLEFAFKACARLLDLFVAGLLPINATDAGARELDTLYWDQEDLLDEATRRSIQARVIGAPGGEIGFGMQPNTEFQTLLMRVVSAVSEYEREQNILTQFDRASMGMRVQSTSGEFVRKAVRDFAANASLRGWAGTAFAAERMAKHIKRVMRVLELEAVRNAFGVSTPWQVVERVSQREFGITVNTVLHRTLAVETQNIMHVIADNHTVWNSSSSLPLFSNDPTAQADLDFATTTKLMRACQHFRAVTGVGDSLVHEYSEPVETTAQPSLPDIGAIGGVGGMSGGGMQMPQVDIGGIQQLRQMASSGQTPSPDQIMQLLPSMN